jgi:SP family arabinose:H+ symporter-like MFS transporter
MVFLAGLIMVPESPRWLIVKSNRVSAGHGSYRELLQPGMRKALLLGLSLPFLSQFSGINAIIYYGPTILQQAGIPIGDSLMSQIFFGIAIVLFTLIAIWKVDRLGRRKLYLIGTISAAISLALTGYCFYAGNTSWLLLVCVLLFLASFAMSIGPLKFVVASEIFPNIIRGRAMSTSIMMMWIADAIVGQLTPMSLASLGAAFTFWAFAGFCVLGFIVVYMFLPETSGRSLEQIEASWKMVH